MTMHSIAEAASLAGKSPKTLYRLIAQGRLSANVSQDGVKQVETSELIRVFGSLKGESHGENLKASQVSHAESELESRVRELENRLKASEALLREKDERIAEMKESNQRLTWLLEHQTGPKPVKETGIDRLFSALADRIRK